MSHVATVDIEIKDLTALAKACETLGLKLNLGQKKYKWYGRSVGDYPLPAGFKASDLGKCDHAISIPGNKRAYEIGVCTNPATGKTELLWDFWQGGYGMRDKVGGNKCEGLVHEYAKEVARNQVSKLAKAEGWTVTENFNDLTGETTIQLRKY
jgi:hypothetical protein